MKKKKTTKKNDVYMQIYNGITKILPITKFKMKIKGGNKYVKLYLDNKNVTKEFAEILGFKPKKDGIEFSYRLRDDILEQGLKEIYESKIENIIQQEFINELNSIKDENPHGDSF